MCFFCGNLRAKPLMAKLLDSTAEEVDDHFFGQYVKKIRDDSDGFIIDAFAFATQGMVAVGIGKIRLFNTDPFFNDPLIDGSGSTIVEIDHKSYLFYHTKIKGVHLIHTFLCQLFL